MTDLSKYGDTLGYSAKVPQSQRIYLHNQRIGLVEILNSAVSKDYLYWFMRTPTYQRQIVGSASGSTVKHTSPSRIYEIKIEVPSLSDQKKIVTILSSIEEKIEVNKKINDNLYPYLKKVLMVILHITVTMKLPAIEYERYAA